MKCTDCQQEIEQGQEVECYTNEVPVSRCFACMKKRNEEILKRWVTELRNR